MAIPRKPRILVVDDDPSLLGVLQQLIQSMNCDVLTASDGKIALEIARREPLTAIITDVRMPNMSGASLLESIEALCLNIPVIVMTGFSDVSELDIENRNGVALLEKPFSKAKLQEVVEIFVKSLPERLAA